jgi:hypothetical protein
MTETPTNTEIARSSKVGRLEELNGHQQLTGRLWEANGTKWTCHFKAEHVAYLSAAWMRKVKLTGRPIRKEGKEYGLAVDSITNLDEDSTNETGAAAGASFWRSLSLEALAIQQGVTAAEDLDAISALWPTDDDPDELLAHIARERRERRRVHESRGGVE